MATEYKFEDKEHVGRTEEGVVPLHRRIQTYLEGNGFEEVDPQHTRRFLRSGSDSVVVDNDIYAWQSRIVVDADPSIATLLEAEFPFLKDVKKKTI